MKYTWLNLQLLLHFRGIHRPRNSGPLEGNIKRVKLIKRQMFGRAKIHPLRKRVLPAS
jgi:transposase